MVTEPRRRVERPKLLSHTATSTVLREEATEVARKQSLLAISNLTTASSQRERVHRGLLEARGRPLLPP